MHLVYACGVMYYDDDNKTHAGFLMGVLPGREDRENLDSRCKGSEGGRGGRSYCMYSMAADKPPRTIL